jgi:hypothetical protein
VPLLPCQVLDTLVASHALSGCPLAQLVVPLVHVLCGAAVTVALPAGLQVFWFVLQTVRLWLKVWVCSTAPMR